MNVSDEVALIRTLREERSALYVRVRDLQAQLAAALERERLLRETNDILHANTEKVAAALAGNAVNMLEAARAKISAMEAVVSAAQERHQKIPDFTQDLPGGGTNVHMCSCGRQFCKELAALATIDHDLGGSGADPEPQPSDGPDYHAEHSAWQSRQPANGPEGGS